MWEILLALATVLNGRYLVVDYSSDLFSDHSRDVAMTTNFAYPTFILYALAFQNELEYRNADARVNSDDI